MDSGSVDGGNSEPSGQQRGGITKKIIWFIISVIAITAVIGIRIGLPWIRNKLRNIHKEPLRPAQEFLEEQMKSIGEMQREMQETQNKLKGTFLFRAKPLSLIRYWATAMESRTLSEVISCLCDENSMRKTYEAGGEERLNLMRDFFDKKDVTVVVHEESLKFLSPEKAEIQVNVSLVSSEGKRSLTAVVVLVKRKNLWFILEQGF